MDRRNRELQALGKPLPHDTFTPDLYRQPALKQGPIEPEPYIDLSNPTVPPVVSDPTSSLSDPKGMGSNTV